MKEFMDFQQQVVLLAEGRSDIQAVLLVGSRAREDHAADEWSDVDLILFADDIEVYVSQDGWLASFGEVLASVFERHQSGDVEWLVLFADGLKMDFYFTPGAEVLTAVITRASYHSVIRRGASLLYARPGTDIQLPGFGSVGAVQPEESEYLALVQAMLINGHKMAKLMRRSDGVRARLVLETMLRPALLTMIAWQAQALFGPERDTWYNGRFLEEWADPRVLAALPTTCGGCTPDEMWRSLFGTLILFRWLAEETAVQWQYGFPDKAADQVMAWIRELYFAATQLYH